MRRAEHQVVGHQRRLLERIAQLADVARPALARQQFDRVGREAAQRQPAAPSDVFHQHLGQRLQVAQALAQWRQPDRQHVQAVVEVGAEAAVGHHRRQVAAGGGDHAHVDPLHLVAAERLDLLLLQHAQQLALQRERHVADLVEEQRAAVGELELAVAALAIGARVRAGRHAEELGLEQALGHRGDVDADERPRRAQARGMDRLREHLLAGAGLAEQQHRARGGRHAPRLPLDLEHRRAAADEAGDRVLGPPLCNELRMRRIELALQPAELGDERLHRRLGMIQQHHAEGADHLAFRIAQRQPADEEGAGLVGQQVDQDRLAGVDHVRHQGVGHHVFDAAPDEVDLGMAERRQELLVTLTDPDDPVLAVDHHRAHRAARKGVEHVLRRQLEHAVGVGGEGGERLGLHRRAGVVRNRDTVGGNQRDADGGLP